MAGRKRPVRVVCRGPIIPGGFSDMHKILRAVVVTSAFLLSLSSLAGAATLALTSVEGTHFTAGGDQLYGWIFSVNTPITVTSLGVYDQNSDGLSISHDVGIYRQSDQVLLGSATVPSGTVGTLDRTAIV